MHPLSHGLFRICANGCGDSSSADERVEKQREEEREREREKCANGCGDSSRVGKKKTERKNVPMDVVTAAAPTSEWKRATVSGSFVGARPFFFLERHVCVRVCVYVCII